MVRPWPTSPFYCARVRRSLDECRSLLNCEPLSLGKRNLLRDYTVAVSGFISRVSVNRGRIPAKSPNPTTSQIVMNRLLLKSSSSLLASLALATTASAQLYWDTNGATPGAGNPADGTWDAAASNWSTDSTGSSATSTYVSGSDVVFSAGSDAATAEVTVSGTQNVSSLSFEEGRCNDKRGQYR